MARYMADTLIHRGPDDAATWADPATGIALGFRRLAILDTSPEGNQPMQSDCGRYVLLFNGEIYNHRALRQELENLHAFRGHSDTEVLLAAIAHWGVEPALRLSVGMFAFALWDRRTRVLTLARDRVGEKPLYYGWLGKVFLFGSELKALRAHPAWKGEVARDVLALFMRYGYVPAPYSIYKGVYKLLPGTFITLSIGSADLGNTPTPKSYWSAGQIAEHGISNPFEGSFQEAADELERLLRQAIEAQMIADVPLGAFLSGGIDSSTIVALMQSQTNQPVRTFTIGFDVDQFNEAKYAKAVASHLQTAHTELYVTPEDALNVIPRMPALYDEPFADSSQIPTYLVSKLARSDITVALAGDGGDELFGGYQHYSLAQELWSKIEKYPELGRRIVSKVIQTVPPTALDIGFSWLAPIIMRYGRSGVSIGDSLYKWSQAIESPESLYLKEVSSWKRPSHLVLRSAEPTTVLTDKSRWLDGADFLQRMMFIDLLTYLPDDILVKVDRASMGVSLETRLPFLDHRIIEFVWKLPMGFRVNEGQTKRLLRKILYKYVPRELIERPKSGFSVPLADWLRGPLRDWAEALLDQRRLDEEGFLNSTLIHRTWREHLSNHLDWSHHLWYVLMFQAWLQEGSAVRSYQCR